MLPVAEALALGLVFSTGQRLLSGVNGGGEARFMLIVR
jgi:hypothetical protein